MEFLFALPILFIPFMFPVIGGVMAKSFGRKFWVWFWLSVPLPFISLILLLILPDKRKNKSTYSPLAYETDELGIYQ